MLNLADYHYDENFYSYFVFVFVYISNHKSGPALNLEDYHCDEAESGARVILNSLYGAQKGSQLSPIGTNVLTVN